jgi:hypothetical protein
VTSPHGYEASPRTVRWFLVLSAVYGFGFYQLRYFIPDRFRCNAEDLFIASILALIGVLYFLVGAAGPWNIKRSEHPISFWMMVGICACLTVFFGAAGLGLTAPACMK